MKKYRDLLDKLKTFSDEELDLEIKISSDGVLTDQTLFIDTDENSLYLFNDVNGEYYYDFEDEEESKEYECEKVLNSKYPIIYLK